MTRGRLIRRLNYTQAVTMTGSLLGIVASTCLMIAGHPSLFVREMGAMFLAATALFAAISILHFMQIFHLQRALESSERIINSQEKTIEILRLHGNRFPPGKG